MNRIKKLARRLQLFAAEPNTITTQQITVNPREVDFVTSFGSDLSALTEVLGIAQPIRKANGRKKSHRNAGKRRGTGGRRDPVFSVLRCSGIL